jgi:hypothetical protein
MNVAVDMADEIAVVERLVGGKTNIVALTRALDVDDEDLLRVGLVLASRGAQERLEERRRRAGRARWQSGTRDLEAIAEGVGQGVELAIAVMRVHSRLAR